MPQLNKGGKYVFGWSKIREDGCVYFPKKVIDEYRLSGCGELILISGSKISGGFCVSTYQALENSKLSNILKSNPKLMKKELADGEAISYKGRRYCWTAFCDDERIELTEDMRKEFELKTGDELLIIRGSNIAYDCIVKGPLVEMAKQSEKTIEQF